MSLEINAISITTSCSVSSTGGHLSAEVDGRSWGWNAGKSEFYEGDNCYVIVYKSENVKIISSACTNGTGWGGAAGPVGYNPQTQDISFSSPVATSSRPIRGITRSINAVFSKCGGTEYSDTVLRLKTWEATLSISAPPPYGFVFIEYDAHSEMWRFSGLVRETTLLSTSVKGTLYGLYTASDIPFKPF